MNTPTTSRFKMPPTVWALGWVSFFTDVSTEIIYPLLPVFLTVTLGASMAFVGLIEGIAESTASLLKILVASSFCSSSNLSAGAAAIRLTISLFMARH